MSFHTLHSCLLSSFSSGPDIRWPWGPWTLWRRDGLHPRRQLYPIALSDSTGLHVREAPEVDLPRVEHDTKAPRPLRRHDSRGKQENFGSQVRNQEEMPFEKIYPMLYAPQLTLCYITHYVAL